MLKRWNLVGPSTVSSQTTSGGSVSSTSSTTSPTYAPPLPGQPTQRRRSRRLTLRKASSYAPPLAFTKESFERTLTEADLFGEFRHYSLVGRLEKCQTGGWMDDGESIWNEMLRLECYACMTVDFCNENIKFWESVVELEDLLGDLDATYNNGLEESQTWALSRYLNKPIASLAPVITVPQDATGHFLYFHATFLASDAPMEVNIPGTVRKQVVSDLQAGTFLSSIFDKAIDEVLSLIYQNTFKSFVV
ncbi:hypothetical protein HK101_004392, partial [Irineochytrium annulatum]